jgi:hypothetical protein
MKEAMAQRGFESLAHLVGQLQLLEKEKLGLVRFAVGLSEHTDAIPRLLHVTLTSCD